MSKSLQGSIGRRVLLERKTASCPGGGLRGLWRTGDEQVEEESEEWKGGRTAGRVDCYPSLLQARVAVFNTRERERTHLG